MTDAQKEEIYRLRLQGIGYKTIAREIFLTVDVVKGYCKRHNLTGPAEMIQVNAQESDLGCLQCKKTVQQKERGRTKMFCSDDCRYTWWNDNKDKRTKNEIAIYQYTCAYCGKHCSSYGNKARKFCSHFCFVRSRFYQEEDGRKSGGAR